MPLGTGVRGERGERRWGKERRRRKKGSSLQGNNEGGRQQCSAGSGSPPASYISSFNLPDDVVVEALVARVSAVGSAR